MTDQALILVAEDDPDDQYFFQEAIAVVCPQDVEAHYLLDGQQLMRSLRQKLDVGYRRKLVVLDLQMQVKNGRTTLREISEDPLLAHIPVVILTTSDSEDDMEYCRRYGAAAFFRKPNSIIDLIEIVRTLHRDYLN